MKKLNEHDLQTAILKYLQSVGILAWRNNTGAFAGEYKGRKRFVPFGIKGASDIFGVLPGGKFLAIEVKASGKKPTKEQRLFMDQVDSQGGLTLWTDDLEQVISFVRSFDGDWKPL